VHSHCCIVILLCLSTFLHCLSFVLSVCKLKSSCFSFWNNKLNNKLTYFTYLLTYLLTYSFVRRRVLSSVAHSGHICTVLSKNVPIYVGLQFQYFVVDLCTCCTYGNGNEFCIVELQSSQFAMTPHWPPGRTKVNNINQQSWSHSSQYFIIPVKDDIVVENWAKN